MGVRAETRERLAFEHERNGAIVTESASGVAHEQRVRVFVVDDHDLVREGLRAVLSAQPDLDLVGMADSYHAALARLPLSSADVAVVDLQLPDGSGVDLCRHVRDHFPSMRTLVLSSFGHDGAIHEAVRSGASGYVVKNIDTTELLDCIRRVAAGRSLVDQRSAESMRERARAGDADARLATLTPQERQLLTFLSEGLTNRQIGARMHLSDKTVKNYVSTLLHKLGVERRAGAAAYYERTLSKRDWSLDPSETHRSPVRY
jgi:two-component system, NarL family, response regulator DevR